MSAASRATTITARTLGGAGTGLVLLATSLCPQERATPAGVVTERVEVGALERTFLLHVPAELPSRPALVLAFHGGGGDGAMMRELVGRSLEPLAIEYGFLAAYPDGFEKHWNDCRGRTTFAAKRLAVDDVRFVRELVQRLVHDHHVDPARVFTLGFSNGGYMAQRLALEVPDEVTAVASIAATLPIEGELDCRPVGRSVPLMAVLGTADPFVPYEGGKMVSPEGISRGHGRSAVESLEYFSRVAGYAGPPMDTDVVTAEPPDTMRVEGTRWSRPGSPEIVLFTIHGGGHVIPGPHCDFPASAGPCERRFDAVAEAVRFFFAGPRIDTDERDAPHATEPGAGT